MAKTSKPKFISPKTKSLKAKQNGVAKRAGHKVQKAKKLQPNRKTVLKKPKYDLMKQAVVSAAAAGSSKLKPKNSVKKRPVTSTKTKQKQKPEIHDKLAKASVNTDDSKSKIHKADDNQKKPEIMKKQQRIKGGGDGLQSQLREDESAVNPAIKDGGAAKANKMVKFEQKLIQKSLPVDRAAKNKATADQPKTSSVAADLKTKMKKKKASKTIKIIKKPKKTANAAAERKAKMMTKMPTIQRETTDSTKLSQARKLKTAKLVVAATAAAAAEAAKRLRKPTTNIQRKSGGQSKASEFVDNDDDDESSNDIPTTSTASETKIKKSAIGNKNEKKFMSASFDESRFFNILSPQNIKNICGKLNTLVRKEVSRMPAAVFDDYRYNLNITCYKIANDPKRMIKLYLKHSLVDIGQDNIAIIVPDLMRGSKVNYDPTIQHFKQMFREAGVKGLTIIPFRQLRNEYNSFESLRKFANSFEYFLCDGRIVGHVSGHCGKIFQKSRTTLHAVHLTNTNAFLREIQRVLKKTAYNNFRRGNMITIPVGNHRFSTDKVAENIVYIIKQLKSVYPGGLPNIRNIYLKINIKGTSSLPLYINLCGAPEQIPGAISTRQKHIQMLQKQTQSILKKFVITKGGELFKINKMPGKLNKKSQLAQKSETRRPRNQKPPATTK